VVIETYKVTPTIVSKPMNENDLFIFRLRVKKTKPEIENKSPEMKKTAFRRRLQRPRVNKKIAIVNRPDAAVKQAILGADRSNF
jgi:hypothetical protein